MADCLRFRKPIEGRTIIQVQCSGSDSGSGAGSGAGSVPPVSRAPSTDGRPSRPRRQAPNSELGSSRSPTDLRRTNDRLSGLIRGAWYRTVGGGIACAGGMQPRRSVAAAVAALFPVGCLAGVPVPTTLTFGVLSNWGGTDAPPYTTPGQVAAAAGLEAVAAATDMSFVLSAGGNFLPAGLPVGGIASAATLARFQARGPPWAQRTHRAAAVTPARLWCLGVLPSAWA